MGEANVAIDLEVTGTLAVEVNEDEPHHLVLEMSDTEFESLIERDEDECTVRLRLPLNEEELLWLLDVIHEAKEEQ